MSEESLRRFLERLNGDTAFCERVRNDAAAAFAEFELSPTEQLALSSGDEDALRRLAGDDVAPFTFGSLVCASNWCPSAGFGCPSEGSICPGRKSHEIACEGSVDIACMGPAA